MIDYAQIQRNARKFAERLPPWATIDADDLAQESILAALHGRRSRKGPMQDALRKQGWIKNHRKTNLLLERASFPEASDRRLWFDPRNSWAALVDIEKLMSRLNPKRKQAIEMQYLYGMEAEEIAVVLNIRVDAVRGRVYEGMKDMRSRIR
jgi:DNA-directed RNA polymerase specialized sigma24 family protein